MKENLIYFFVVKEVKVVPVAKHYLIAYQPHEALLFFCAKKKSHRIFYYFVIKIIIIMVLLFVVCDSPGLKYMCMRTIYFAYYRCDTFLYVC